MKIENFCFSELFHNCSRNEIMNALSKVEITSNLCGILYVLQRIRNLLYVPLYVNSCYRDFEHNKRVGGSATSQHLTASAVDVSCGDFHDLLHCIRIVCEPDPEIDLTPLVGQVIIYPDKRFVHIGLPNDKYPNFTCFICENGKYTPINIKDYE